MSPALVGLLAAATNCAAGVDVRVAKDNTIDIEAKGVSLSSVLECLSERVGFKMVIERGLYTSQPVTISMSRKTQVQAMFSVLEGQGINYAYSSDRTGSRILMLLISARSDRGPASSIAPSVTSPTSARSTSPRAPEASRVEVEPALSTDPPNDRLPENMYPGYYPPGQVPPPYQQGQTSPANPQGQTPPVNPQGQTPPLYPEPHPLSPQTMRDASQVHGTDVRSRGTTGGVAAGPPSAKPRSGRN